MSKKKPSGVFLVPVLGGEPVYVLARHPKGAAMAATMALRGTGRVVGLTRDVREADACQRWRCINLMTPAAKAEEVAS